MPRECLRSLLPFGVLATVAVAFVAFLLLSARIPPGADQAIVGLMARHILGGAGHPVFYWGAAYAGTFEPHVVASVFALFGATMSVFRGVMCGFYTALGIGTTLLAFRFFGRRAALVSAAYFALPPFFLPYKVLTSDGAYATVALVALAALWGALGAEGAHVEGRPIAGPLGALGFTAGFGLWITPVTIPFAAAVLAWTAVRTRRSWSKGVAAAFVCGFALGSVPWWAWNSRHGWASLHAPEIAATAASGVPEKIGKFLSTSLSVFVGAARPNFSDDPHAPFPGALILLPLLVLVLAAPALEAIRRDARLGLLALAIGAQACATVLSARSSPAEPRYLVAAYVALPVLLGAAASRTEAGALRSLWTVGFAALLAAHVSSAFHARRHLQDVDDAQVTAPLEPLIAELKARGITRVWTNYWAAYRLTFESGEGIVAAPISREDADRYAPIRDAVLAAPDPAVVLLPPRDSCFRRYLQERGEPYNEAGSGAFTAFYALPAPVRDLVRSAGALPMPSTAYRPAWSATELPARLAPGEEVVAHARVQNEGACTWMNNVRLVASWAGPETREDVFPVPGRRVAPGESADLSFLLRAPAIPGRYALRLDLEQEGIARFSEKGGASEIARVNVGR